MSLRRLPGGLGRCITIGAGNGVPWSSYWLTRYISNLDIVTDSETQQTVTATIIGIGYDGVSFERSTDRVNWSEVQTGIDPVFVSDQLTADIFYFYRARLYKGANYSPYSGVYFNVTSYKWYFDGNVPPVNVKGAYDPVQASSLADSYVNRANPGTNDLVPVVKAPTWSKALGWSFDGTHWLNTGIVPENDQTWSMIAKFSGTNGVGDQCLVGLYEATNERFYLYISQSANAVAMGNGGGTSIQPKLASGVISFAGNKGYVLLTEIAAPIGAPTGTFALACLIGAINASPVPLWQYIGNIQAVAIYDIVLSPTQLTKITTRVHNLDQYEQQRWEFVHLGFGLNLDFSLCTFYYTGDHVMVPNLNPDVFNPTDLDIDEWLDMAVTSGAKYAVWCAKMEDGWCMWPTNVNCGNAPYSIAQSAWYVANGSPDLTAQFMAKCKERGLKPVLYFSIADLTHETRTGTDETTDAASYIAMIDAQLTELLNNYDDIYAIWFDDWNWHISYANIPFEGRYNLIKSIQPKCLVYTNEQLHPRQHGDIDVYEAGQKPSAGNLEYSERIKTIRLDGIWIYEPSQNDVQGEMMTKAQILADMSEANSRNCTYLLACLPDRTGHIPPVQKSIFESLTT